MCVCVPHVCSAAVVRSAGVRSASGVCVRESLWRQTAAGRHTAHTSAADAHTPETHKHTRVRDTLSVFRCVCVCVCVPAAGVVPSLLFDSVCF